MLYFIYLDLRWALPYQWLCAFRLGVIAAAALLYIVNTSAPPHTKQIMPEEPPNPYEYLPKISQSHPVPSIR